MAWELTLGNRTARAEVTRLEDGRYRVLLDGNEHLVDYRRLGPRRAHMMDGARSLEVIACPGNDDCIEVTLYGRTHVVAAIDERRKVLDALGPGGGKGGAWALRSPMPGKVVRVLVEDGQEVAEGDGLVVVEAMKMENELKAERAGVVTGILATPGESVEGGATLLSVEHVEA